MALGQGGDGGPEGECNAASFTPDKDDVFARIADRYDRLCDVFSLFAHRLWKERMAARVAAAAGEVVLDVATGTGDIPARLLRRCRDRGRAPARLVVSDLCPQMLALAREKLAREKLARLGPPDAGMVEFALLDAHDLGAMPSASVDVYSMSFAMKICDRRRAVAEAFRVLRPGGLFLCLEAGHIPVAWIQAAYLLYMERCIPAIGWLATRDRSSYAYLLRGIRDFPAQGDFARELEAQGFREVSWENLTFGIVALHRAVRP